MTKSLNTRRKRLNFSKEPLLLKTIKNNKLNNEFNFRDAFLKSVFTNEPNLNTNEKEINILIAEDDEDDYEDDENDEGGDTIIDNTIKPNIDTRIYNSDDRVEDSSDEDDDDYDDDDYEDEEDDDS